MEDKKKKTVGGYILSKIFLALFFAFVTLYVAGVNGYFEYELHKKTVLTEEKAKKFEEDVLNGVEVDIKDYMKEEEINYATNISKLGLYFSDNLSTFLKNGVEDVLSFINRLVEG